jgi:hypothetical protein
MSELPTPAIGPKTRIIGFLDDVAVAQLSTSLFGRLKQRFPNIVNLRVIANHSPDQLQHLVENMDVLVAVIGPGGFTEASAIRIPAIELALKPFVDRLNLIDLHRDLSMDYRPARVIHAIASHAPSVLSPLPRGRLVEVGEDEAGLEALTDLIAADDELFEHFRHRGEAGHATGQPVLEVEFTAPEGISDEELVEYITRLAVASDNLHRVNGGNGLTVEITDIRQPAVAEVVR